jgi:small-conductance mechanosensitive channel/CRP-like cAMP-binding protein
MQRVLWPLACTLVLFSAYTLLRVTTIVLITAASLRYLLVAALISLSIVLVRVSNFILLDVLFRKSKGREAPAILRVLLGTIIYAALFALIYSWVLEMSLSAALTTSAVVTIIIGLALQDTLGNFFAGVSIHIEQPFQIGDVIQLDNMLGRVEAITWRATSLRTNNNTLVIFPNSKVARNSLEVFRTNSLNRHALCFPGPHTVAPQTLIPLVCETVRTITHVAPEITPIVRVSNFAESHLQYEVLYWIRDYMRVPEIDAKIRERVWYIFHRHAIPTPFPVCHVLFESREPIQPAARADYSTLLAGIDIFAPLEPEERNIIVRALDRYVYAPGEVILRRGEPGKSMFVIARGQVEVCMLARNGALQQAAVLGAGDFFGEMALFTGAPRSADVIALEEVEVLEIGKTSIQSLLEHNTRLAETFGRKIAERQARRAERLSHYRDAPPEEHPESLLSRIKHFFDLV